MINTVEKPWGREEWLELNDKYCFKVLYVAKGHKLSLQLHEEKIETLFVVSGRGVFTLEQPEVNLKEIIFSPGHWITIRPKQKHRIEALENLKIVEASSPQVEDVVRFNDDYDRV